MLVNNYYCKILLLLQKIIIIIDTFESLILATDNIHLALRMLRDHSRAKS